MSQVENLIELLTQAEEMKDWDLVIRVIDELRKSIIQDEVILQVQKGNLRLVILVF